MPGQDPAYLERLQKAQLEWLVRSEAAARSLSENYTGLPFDWAAPRSPVAAGTRE